MNADVGYKLLAIFLDRRRARGASAGCAGSARRRRPGNLTPVLDPARVLGNSAFYIFIPALLCRTTARLDIATLPWHTLLAYFVPVQVFLFGLYGWHHYRQRRHPEWPPAMPAVRTITSMFGNTAQVGIPIVTAIFGERGLGIHVTVMGLHGLILLSTLTILVELDLARARARSADAPSVRAVAFTTLRNTIIHPVVLPVTIGWLWNLTGLPLPPVIDEVLALLSTAVVPVSLVVIGISLAYIGAVAAARSVADQRGPQAASCSRRSCCSARTGCSGCAGSRCRWWC